MLRCSALACLALTACGPEFAADPGVDQRAQAIENGSLVGINSLSRRTTVGLTTFINFDDDAPCTGTIIGPSHILTATHCVLQPGTTVVNFFSDANVIGFTRSVKAVYRPNWVNEQTKTYESPEGQLRDFAVVQLANPIPSGFNVALLPSEEVDAHTHVGQGVTVVGTGKHDDVVSGGTQMRFRATEILEVASTASNSDGSLFVTDEVTNKGDSGGPIFASTAGDVKVVGVVQGRRYRLASSAYRSYFTVVRDHVGWIRAAMADNVAPTRILSKVPEACNGTVQFSIAGPDEIMSRNDTAAHAFSGDTVIEWACDGTRETTSCPPGTNTVRALRTPAGSRDFVVECRQFNPAK